MEIINWNISEICDEKSINLRIKEDWVISLGKKEIEFIILNENLFDNFIVDFANDFLNNWEEHLITQEKIKDLINDNIEIILDKKS